MAMTKKVDIDGKIVTQGKAQGFNHPKQNFQGSPSKNISGGSPSRLSPVRGSPNCFHMSELSPRLSPGLVTGHYAGCKFAEPPSASALPLPPQHWMYANQSVMLPFQSAIKPSIVDQHHDFTQQLKLLLKVQA